MNLPRLLFVALATCLLLLAGCGDDSETTSTSPATAGESEVSAAGLDACKLLSNEDVEAAIGEPVSNSQGQSSADGSASCSWFGAETDSLQQKGVTLIAAADNGKERWEAHKQLVSGEVEPEPDFGDEAFTDSQVVAGYQGDSFVVVSPLYADAGVTLEQVKPLGQQAFAELG